MIPAIAPLRPVYQTIYGQLALRGWENCKEASIATLLNLQLRDVPPLNRYTAAGAFDPWATWTALNAWFAARGLCLLQLHAGLTPDCYYLAEGPTYPVRDGEPYVGHMVVMRAGNLAHDPLGPGFRGLWRVDHVYVVVPQALHELRPHGWHPPALGGLQLDPAAHVIPAPAPDPWEDLHAMLDADPWDDAVFETTGAGIWIDGEHYEYADWDDPHHAPHEDAA